MAKLESDLLSLNSQIVKYLSRLDSRDKLCRSVAYGSDFWAWLFTMSGSTALAAFAQHFPKIKSQVGVARKIYRIGNPLREVEAIATAQEVGLPKNMKVVMHTCNGIYYAIDTVELLCILGIAKWKPADVKTLRYKFWAVKTVINVTLIMAAVHKCFSKIKAARKAAKEQGPESAAAKSIPALRASLRKLQAQMIVAISDVPLMFFNSTEWGKKNIPAPAAGFSGMVGSLVGAHEIWRVMHLPALE
mmetsp:Transcript_53484/g.127236  ORF Transcript_53484/g.127236 Transcript_53484/m.127236 type:complete len:246 (-) Transcript_53484:62-799(-)|eukprot:CAMPEP_0180137412 /NCGR_PEP_ID=MMETSP0986-20121125/12193_1 /TAXON_ID=697907 /ORGANISM="non described non described, Strain CCMP2293" /LENGTH=245 /DNA_ID=CAMNT_0022078861 /DNA_START=102 /DNA_END=839 /DNA_ORIENTATION=-